MNVHPMVSTLIGCACGLAVGISLVLVVDIIRTLYTIFKKCCCGPKSSQSSITTWRYEPMPARRETAISMSAPSAPFEEEEHIYTELTIRRP